MANLMPGEKAVPFELLGVDDRRHALGDYADKEAVAVVFTCNHCPYARAWEDRLIYMQADYASRGVQLVAINANDARKYPDDSFPRMKERSEEKGFNFPYLYDKGGALRYDGTVDDNYDDPAAVKTHYFSVAREAVLDGSEPPTTETAPVGCTIKWK